ncbi:DUF1116 domain-containing protein, partial [Intrasporangium sp.]|uniref:DUF1116 domain-containing protein n=1 Tax=Intrasporangium sp. TaxID=1925024 RepID=UPI00293ADA30
MADQVEIRTGAYYDSVSLMQVSQTVAAATGVEAAQVAMATELNLDVIRSMGFDVPDTGPNDLVIAIRGDEEGIAAGKAALDEALARLRSAATQSGGFGEAPAPRTLGAAVLRAGANLALVSVPGPHATTEALDAIDAGVSVMVFSDNVPVEDEVRLKERAARQGVLVMGPDCGTAMVGGVALGFANVVRPGSVGIVAASGTGAQQVMSLLDAAGVGVSHVLGVGGRDLSAAVAGRSTKQALAALAADPDTETIIVVSKPPAAEVLSDIESYAAGLATPVHWATLGAGKPDLTAAVESVLASLGRQVEWPSWEVGQPAATGTSLRGLFCGGTLADEAMLVAGEELGDIRSNTPLRPDLALGPDLRDPGHVVIDFGDDSMTQGRPHPMIDPSLRLERIAAEAADPTCGVLLLDLVLGHAAHPDPAPELAEAIRAARARAESDGRTLPVVISLTGTEGDPQGLSRSATALRDAGATVYLSNAAATRHAVELLGHAPAAPASAASPAAYGTAEAESVGDRAEELHGLLTADLSVATAGVSLFAESVRAQAVPVAEAAWQPPLAGTERDLAVVLADPRRDEANQLAFERMVAAGADFVDVRPAHEALGLEKGTFLHAGPPITFDRASGPLKGALIGAMLFEGLADTAEEAEAKLEKGDGITLEPCHHRDAVGPMAGVISPSMWLYELRDDVHGNLSWCSLNEGLGKVLRYGAYGPEVIDRLHWMNSVLGPLLQQAVRARVDATGPIDVKAIIAQMLQMGDEGHNRNRAGSLMLLRELLPTMITADAPSTDIAEAVRFSGANEHFFLNLGMPACKLST